MSDSQMTSCERRTQYKRDGGYEWRWKEVPVSEAIGSDSGSIRCVHCHGAVRIHRQKVAHGPQDHVEHMSRQDSENCRGGHHFKGTHRRSSQPVE